MARTGGTKHGEYIVKNRDKYIGTKMPKYRSSWEERWCYWFDHNNNVIKWGFEMLTIPYFYQVDKKTHRYITDFYAEIKDNKGEIRKYVIEVKPYQQTLLPKAPKNQNKKAQNRYLTEMTTFVKNKNKWDSAIAYCEKKGLRFMILTEKSMF